MRIVSIHNGPNVHSNKKAQPFGGLTKSLKNRIYLDGQKDIEVLLSKHPNTNPVTGQLPNFIFQQLPKENRREAILDILNTFDKVAFMIRDYIPRGAAFQFNNSDRYRPKEANAVLSDVFRKYGILTDYDDDIDLVFVGQGGKGKVFKLEGLRDEENEDEYVIKVFHQLKGMDWHPFKSHGCYAEINNGTYWRYHEGHDTHRGKFFFASLRSGYIVSKFLDEDVRLPQRVVPEYRYGIKCTDEEKEGPINGYNRIKGYNYDYGGMRVVNRLKNSDKIARTYLEKIKKLPPEERSSFWFENFRDKRNTENKVAGLALGIKHMDNKNFLIEKCLTLNKTLVNRALGYVLKYLPFEDAKRYFEILVQTDDPTTQVILFNEIPLLAKRKDEGVVIQDDINVAMREIIPERIYDYYMISEKYALPETVEHLASFVHLLPRNKVKQQYIKLTNIKNRNLQERLIWKLNFLEPDVKTYAVKKLKTTVKDPLLVQKLNSYDDDGNFIR